MAEYDLTDFRMKYENGEYYINFLYNDTGERIDAYVGSDDGLEEEFENFLDDIKYGSETGTLDSDFSYRFDLELSDLFEGISKRIELESEWFAEEHIMPNDCTYDTTSYANAFIALEEAWYKKAKEFIKNSDV